MLRRFFQIKLSWLGYYDDRSLELYVISGNVNDDNMSKAEITSSGIVFKLKGVLKHMSSDIHAKFENTQEKVDNV